MPTDLELPAVGQREFDAASVREAEEYERVARWLAIASQLVLIAVLAVYAKRGASLMRESAAGPIGTGFLLGMLGFAIAWLAQLPFSLVDFWWAKKYEVAEIGYPEWLIEEAFTLAFDALYVCLVLLIVMAFARLVRTAWWLPAGVTVIALTYGFAWVSGFLVPGLERPSSAIRADTRALERAGLPDVEVGVEAVREWTSAPNAYALGLGDTRKVVLWDTLVDDFPRDEVRVVLAHELGHHEHDHIAKQVGWIALFVLPTGFIVALITRRRGGLGEPAAVPLALLVFVVLSFAMTPVNSAFSRRAEAEADWAALEATKDPKAMEALFKGFTDEGLADPDPPGWWTAVFESHQTGADRVAMARAWRDRERRGR